MKHLPVAGKAITLVFAAALLAACSGSSKKDEDQFRHPHIVMAPSEAAFQQIAEECHVFEAQALQPVIF